MKNLVFLLLVILFFACSNNRRDAVIKDNISVIPRPLSVKVSNNDFFELITLVAWVDAKYNSVFTDTLLYGIDTNGIKVEEKDLANLVIEIDESIKPEGYYLEINDKRIIIKAADASGAQYGLTSLKQMVILDGKKLPICKIQDIPKFAYRGMHLDVGRHFFAVSDIKKYIDYLAEYKYNYFHWHLTEDQGWRIEIKKYPKLTEVGAYRNETLVGHYNDEPHKFDGKRYGGFYTQEEVKVIVKYAGDRNITVIPEIEMPGHALAALASYPALGCTGGPHEVATKWGVFPEVFCPYDSTFMFLEDVIDEVIALFPGKYIHIGGDECPKDSWKASAFCQNLIKQLDLKDEHGLQSYFIQRMEKYINSKGKQIIGWDEILEGGLAPNATVMSWRGNEGGIEAANQKHDVIMTPGSHCYFDHYQSANEDEPLAIGGLTTLDKVYSWEVIPAEVDRRHKKYILGGQANLWTEYINNYPYLEYMAFSRGLAMSEALWSDAKNYKNFLKRYEKHNNYLKSKGVNIANHLYDIKANPTATADGSIDVTFEGLDGMKVLCADDKGGNMMIKIDEKYTMKSSGKYTFTGIKGDKTGKSVRITIELHKGTTAKITSDQQPSEKYFGGGINALANGIEGSDAKYGGNEWLGFEGTDCNLLFELPQSDSISQVDFRFFKGEGQWIYLPKSIKVSFSEDNKTFNEVFVSDSIVTDGKVAKIRASFPKSSARYIKIQITNHGVIAEGKQGAGHKAWLFVDEIRVE